MAAKTWIAALAFALSLVGTSLTPAPAQADEPDKLGEEDFARLSRGETVTRQQTLENGSARYVGGVTYTIIDATPDELSALLEDVASYKRVLPRTKDARLVGQNDGDMFVELHQGNALVDAAYTIRIHKEEREAKFWLVRSKPHAIADAWGFFRYSPIVDATGTTKVLLTYGILVDLGPGLVRDLFEERVRHAMLGVPQLVRGYVASHVRARAGL